MDEVFGSGNFVSLISFKTASALGQRGIGNVYDYLIWYARDGDCYKFRSLYKPRNISDDREYRFIDDTADPRGFRRLTEEEFSRLKNYEGLFRRRNMTSSGFTPSCTFDFELDGVTCKPAGGKSWATNRDGVARLMTKKRLFVLGKDPYFKHYQNDFPLSQFENSWADQPAALQKSYVVETAGKFVQRCMLMTTDPGDLILDPTCGSGTTAYVAEQWGRRWITADTSRIALNIAKTRLATAIFPWYSLYDPNGEDVRQGFHYKRVPHVTLKSLANDEPPEEETLYDQPEIDRNKLRVTGPFTVETLQSFEPTPPEAIESGEAEAEGLQRFAERVFAHLQAAGIKNGIRNENAVFTRVNPLAHEALHAEGFYTTQRGEAKAYLHIGPQFGMVSRQSVNEAIKECRLRGDADWLVIMGFAFESDIENRTVDTKLGGFMVTKVRMHDDLMQEGLIKKDKKSASFVTIGEPDVALEKQKDGSYVVEIRGLDIYDPIKDEVKPRSAADIAYWMVDDNYDGSSFIVRQVFFCGGDKDEFDKWKKGLSDIDKQMTKKQVEQTLKVEIDDEAFDRLYGHRSHPVSAKKGRRIAVRVISQFGEESTKVLTLA